MDIEKGFKEAREVVKRCSTSNGLYASAPPKGYTSVWARDSVITFLGASLLPEFKEQFRVTLDTLSKYQAESGQIANAVDMFDPKRKQQVTFATIDSTLWYLIGIELYARRYDKLILKKYEKNIQKAFTWVFHQDTGEEGLPEQHPTSDWQDAFPHKYGHTINTQALYYHALELYGKTEIAEHIWGTVNGLKREDMKFFDKEKGHYVPWIWKTHGVIREQGEWFDSLGNLLCIIFELADEDKSKSIMDFIKKNGLDKPCPLICMYPPIKKGEREWQRYFNTLNLKPFQYLNGGIWPYIGGFYAVALMKLGRWKEARHELAKLAEFNLKGRFPEWIHPKTKESYGDNQAWSAGTYMLAYMCLNRKKGILL